VERATGPWLPMTWEEQEVEGTSCKSLCASTLRLPDGLDCVRELIPMYRSNGGKNCVVLVFMLELFNLFYLSQQFHCKYSRLQMCVYGIVEVQELQ
jgi:hypothetical protein